jgi:hypothetical protein
MFLTNDLVCVSLDVMKHEDTIRARSKLLAHLPPCDEILRGSLLHRLIRHRRGCPKCERGGGHPVWVLTVGYPGGKTRQISIPADRHKQVQEWLDNYRKLRKKLEAVCELNHNLLRPEK